MSPPDVFTAVSTSTATYGVVPIENSSFGPVAETTEQLRTAELALRGMTALRIGHALLASKQATEAPPRRVYSHEQVSARGVFSFTSSSVLRGLVDQQPGETRRVGADRRALTGPWSMSTVSEGTIPEYRDRPSQLDGQSRSRGRPRYGGDGRLLIQMRRGLWPPSRRPRYTGRGRE